MDSFNCGIAPRAATLEPVLSGPEAMVVGCGRARGRLMARPPTSVTRDHRRRAHFSHWALVRALQNRDTATFSVLHLDAHTDMRDEYLGARAKPSHGDAPRALSSVPVAIRLSAASQPQSAGTSREPADAHGLLACGQRQLCFRDLSSRSPTPCT